METIQGRLQLKTGGFGFVGAEGGDIYISADKRRVRAGSEKKWLLGSCRTGAGAAAGKARCARYCPNCPYRWWERWTNPNAPCLLYATTRSRRMFISQKIKNGGAHNFDKVVGLHCPSAGTATKARKGKLWRCWAARGDAGVDILGFARRFGLVAEFGEEVEREAAGLEYREADTKGRLDLRGGTIFTIDGADAKDLDDAVSLELLPNGNYKLGVHIAGCKPLCAPGWGNRQGGAQARHQRVPGGPRGAHAAGEALQRVVFPESA